MLHYDKFIIIIIIVFKKNVINLKEYVVKAICDKYVNNTNKRLKQKNAKWWCYDVKGLFLVVKKLNQFSI